MDAITSREGFLLHKGLDWTIARYLMANTFGRGDGAEKATRHREISEWLWEFIELKPYTVEIHEEVTLIHDFLAHHLTDRLDEVIDFPIDRPIHNYNNYQEKFCDVLINLIPRISKMLVLNRTEPVLSWMIYEEKV